MKSNLLEPYKSEHLLLANRIVMAPMTRCRATENHIPTDIMALYYKQRASVGLIVSEAVPVMPQGVGYYRVPGIWTAEQTEAWKPITKAVHEQNGKIFMQLWHVGRNSHSVFLNGDLPVSASAIPMQGIKRTHMGKFAFETPRALEISEIPGIVEHYAQGAKNAIAAGFDGVEIHGANGYLPEQFINESSNQRTDEYGGSIENRCRFVLEVVEAVVKAVGSDKTGIRLSPSGIVNDMLSSNPIETFEYLITELNKFNLAYLHLEEPFTPREELPSQYTKYVAKHFRKFYQGALIINGGYTKETGEEVIEQGFADMVSYGKPLISNPDLVYKFEHNLPLTKDVLAFYYTHDEKGYTDYPTAI